MISEKRPLRIGRKDCKAPGLVCWVSGKEKGVAVVETEYVVKFDLRLEGLIPVDPR